MAITGWHNLLNIHTEDLGTIASSTRKKDVYKYYCSSNACCTKVAAVEKFMSQGIEKEYKKFERVDKVLKKTTSDFIYKCADCGGALFSKKIKKQRREK